MRNFILDCNEVMQRTSRLDIMLWLEDVFEDSKALFIHVSLVRELLSLTTTATTMRKHVLENAHLSNLICPNLPTDVAQPPIREEFYDNFRDAPSILRPLRFTSRPAAEVIYWTEGNEPKTVVALIAPRRALLKNASLAYRLY